MKQERIVHHKVWTKATYQANGGSINRKKELKSLKRRLKKNSLKLQASF